MSNIVQMDFTLLKRTIESLTWMLIDLKHREDEIQKVPEGQQANYSKWLLEAVEVLEELIKLKQTYLLSRT